MDNKTTDFECFSFLDIGRLTKTPPIFLQTREPALDTMVLDAQLSLATYAQ